MQQNQKRQIQSYIINAMAPLGKSDSLAHSLPPLRSTQPASAPTVQPISSSAHEAMMQDPDSPLSIGMDSTATSVSEVGDNFKNFKNLAE